MERIDSEKAKQIAIEDFKISNGKSNIEHEVTVTSRGVPVVRVWNKKVCAVYKYGTKEILKTYRLKGQ